jgi:hypothetical protein
MRTLVEYPAFIKQAEAVWNEDEYNAFTFWIAQNPEAGGSHPGGARGAQGALGPLRYRKKRRRAGDSLPLVSRRSQSFSWQFMPKPL